ncbi:hypothetical protein GLOTRDRAFT_127917 [Gloeophyllum trabeum ATCC 11539]|uniref:Dynamitin-domain-containing protein n=1 Tax=Gloeophyllum trabeum (strain ATCC 11539 / FP-39264 / Madison 617) TaxID=670483 RepID=S7QE45_GLOTA|nr:uncharacterized protein GLOTRDRAFT_127917 [Gloeophyllum trabeum ATCC 11539]EPQ57687.1 hypothetical protein GLOTRDRAFT_127917 [Gloeophyllum trabeum ATCC 11539]
MSVNKYANLPDIDTAPDVYETEDVFPTTATKGESSDEEAPSRPPPRTKNGDGNLELDSSHLIGADEASKRFKKAERRRAHRTEFTYPPSPTSDTPPTRAKPLSYRDRLRLLQSELTTLEAELSDPSNPALHKEREEEHVDPGELIRGLVDVKGRLEKISKVKEGRGRLVEAILRDENDTHEDRDNEKDAKGEKDGQEKGKGLDVRNVAEMDKRVGELEKIIGSSTTSLDETSPLPPPLLPMLTRLNAQLTLLTQPRHIDSISRRLKLLLSDLERTSHGQGHGTSTSRKPHHPQQQPTAPAQPVSASPLLEQLTPLLTRLAPNLPHIPHILTRLRTLSALHTSAAEFQSTLESLEEDQRKVREALEDLSKAVTTVEKSLEENRGTVKGNVQGLEDRVEGLVSRLEELSR